MTIELTPLEKRLRRILDEQVRAGVIGPLAADLCVEALRRTIEPIPAPHVVEDFVTQCSPEILRALAVLAEDAQP